MSDISAHSEDYSDEDEDTPDHLPSPHDPEPVVGKPTVEEDTLDASLSHAELDVIVQQLREVEAEEEAAMCEQDRDKKAMTALKKIAQQGQAGQTSPVSSPGPSYVEPLMSPSRDQPSYVEPVLSPSRASMSKKASESGLLALRELIEEALTCADLETVQTVVQQVMTLGRQLREDERQALKPDVERLVNAAHKMERAAVQSLAGGVIAADEQDDYDDNDFEDDDGDSANGAGGGADGSGAIVAQHSPSFPVTPTLDPVQTSSPSKKELLAGIGEADNAFASPPQQLRRTVVEQVVMAIQNVRRSTHLPCQITKRSFLSTATDCVLFDCVGFIDTQELVEDAMHAVRSAAYFHSHHVPSIFLHLWLTFSAFVEQIAEDPISPIGGGSFEASDEDAAAYQYDNDLAHDIAQSLSDSGAWSDDIDGLSLVASVDPSDQAVVGYIESIFAFARWQRGSLEPEPEPDLRHATESEIALGFILPENHSPNHQLFVAFERKREQAAAAEAEAAGTPVIAAVTEEQQIYSLALFDSCAEVVAAALAEIDPTSRRYRRRRSRLGVTADPAVVEPFYLTQAMLTERVLAQTKWQRASSEQSPNCLAYHRSNNICMVILAHCCSVSVAMQSGKRMSSRVDVRAQTGEQSEKAYVSIEQ